MINQDSNNKKNKVGGYNASLFALLGTVYMVMYFPSFNAVNTPSETLSKTGVFTDYNWQKHRQYYFALEYKLCL